MEPVLSTLPASLHTERTVLGAMLLEPEAVHTGLMELSPSDFSLDSHRRVFQVLADMASAGEGIDTTTVRDALEQRKELDSIGGVTFLLDLTYGIPPHLNVAEYVSILREKTALRRVLEIVTTSMSRVTGGDDPEAILADMQRGVHETQMQSNTVRPVSIAEFILPTLDEMRAQRAHKGEVLGISSGIAPLDEITTGFRDGELTYVGAMPGRGKTSFMLQALYHAAVTGVPTGCISLEMRGKQLVRRLGIMHSKIHAQRMRDPRPHKLNDADWRYATDSIMKLGDLPIQMCDQSGLRPGQIASLARQMHTQGARIIFVDFVQIIHEDGKDRREAINRVSASLRDTCKTLEIPFVVASQLARADKRDINHRPTIQDLRESGNLEQDAHNVLLLYRPKDRETSDWTGEDEIIIDKQREGVTGSVPVAYDDALLRFKERHV